MCASLARLAVGANPRRLPVWVRAWLGLCLLWMSLPCWTLGVGARGGKRAVKLAAIHVDVCCNASVLAHCR
eukprot:810620-Alexandrium_andersonii.AAC.1